MADPDQQISEQRQSRKLWPRRKRWRLAVSLMLFITVSAIFAYAARRDIAGNIIEQQLDAVGLEATYDVGSIAPERQVLENVVIGDPARPDLTVEQVVVNLRYRFGTPVIGRIELVRPRLYGTYLDGQLSFGELDTVLFAESDDEPGLPDLDVKLVDGRALLETDYGPVGIKAQGEGEIDDGFVGILAAVGPKLDFGDCAARGASVFGDVRVRNGRPRLTGPLRLASLDCAEAGIRVRNATLQTNVNVDEQFDGVVGESAIAIASLALDPASAEAIDGRVGYALRNGFLNIGYDVSSDSLALPQAQMNRFTAEGSVRMRGMVERVQLEAQISSGGIRLGNDYNAVLAQAQRSASDTLIAPLLGKLRGAIASETRGASMAAELTLRQTGTVRTLVMPTARLRSGNGDTLLALSRVSLSSAGAGPPRFSGNLATGGDGLPLLTGRMERGEGGQSRLRLQMAPYSSGDASLAIPEMVLVQGRDGGIGFAGQAIASGKLPGGLTRNLVLPLTGRWSPGGQLALWNSCTDVRFDRLVFANLSLERRGIRLCPTANGSIVRAGPSGLRIAAGIPSLDVSGKLGETPIRLSSGAIGFAWPGALAARDVDVLLGPVGTASSFRISDLRATLGRDIAGSFVDADVRLNAVPLDITGANGNWRYAGGLLSLDEGAFTLVDRSDEARFEPLVARDGTLSLVDNVIRAQADLRHPASDRLVTAVDILHDLATGTGHADLDVPGLLFDDTLQPENLTRNAQGVIALASGTITGKGRIDWNEGGVTSTGAFSSESLDFAAAFGPVKGASGTVVFSDLLGLTTAPGQVLRVASVNPGIEVTDGEIEFVLRNGELLSLAGGNWPFMGGRLILRPVELNIGASERRAYVFEIVGLDAAQFIAQMDLGNISATGIFDGEIPIIFDETGTGSIVGGRLVSRDPGGNVSYVGELTYEDLSPIANFAFDALRSLDYRRMTISMDGTLSGEIITAVRFEGVSQGEGTRSNFITRQIARLPLEFRVNIRAAFAQLITSMRSLYDPAYVRDPRELGLLDDDGTRLRRQVQPPPKGIKPEDLIPQTPSVQTNESESMP